MGSILGQAAGFAFQQWLRNQVRSGLDTPNFPKFKGEVVTYQQSVRRLIEKAAGPVPKYAPLEAEIHQVHQRDGYRIEAVSFPTFSGLRMTANAYVPESDVPVPGILAVHGHSKHGRRDPKMQQRCIALAKSGYFVLAVDAIGNGERGVQLPGAYHGGNLAGALWTIGYSLFGIQIHENYRACDYLVSRPEVDETKLAISGASGGGNQSFYSGAWDDRFTAVVPVCSMGSYRKLVSSFNCMCETPSGLAGALEQYDVVASMAPRALLVIVAKVDNVSFRFEDAQNTMDEASKVWNLLGKSDRVSFAAVHDRHGYPQSARELCLGWFNRWLKGTEDDKPVKEPDVQLENYATLSCYPSATSSRVMTLPALFSNTRSQVKTDDIFKDKEETLNRLRHVFSSPKKIRLASEPVNLLPQRTTQSTGVSYLFQTDDSVLIPAHAYWPDFSHTANDALLMVGENKEKLSSSPLAKEALNKGMAVWAFDLPGIGEGRLPGEVSDYAANLLNIEGVISAARACHMLGFNLVGYWLSLIQSLADKVSTGMKSLSLAVSGGSATAVLAGASLLSKFDRLIISNPLASYRLSDTFQNVPFESLIPDLLTIGDIPEVASLAAPAPMTIVAPFGPDGSELPIEDAQRIFSPITIQYETMGQSELFHLVGGEEANSAFLLDLVN